MVTIEYRTARNDDIEIRVDLERPASKIQYRILSEDEINWLSTPFQRADVSTEDDALVLVDTWLGD